MPSHGQVWSAPRRQQQVAELRQQLPGVEALNRDGSLYEIPMRLRDGHNTRLRISLPPGFPEVTRGWPLGLPRTTCLCCLM